MQYVRVESELLTDADPFGSYDREANKLELGIGDDHNAVKFIGTKEEIRYILNSLQNMWKELTSNPRSSATERNT